MVVQVMRLLGASVFSLGVLLTCDLPDAHAKKGHGAVNNERPSTGNKYNVWRGKTHLEPKDGHIEGAIVYVDEQGSGPNAKLIAKIYLYAAKKKAGRTNDHTLILAETYEGELTSRHRISGKGHGKNRDLNLMFDEEVPGGSGLRRRVLLTASRTHIGRPQDADRTVRLVTSTYRPAGLVPEPAPEPDSNPGCGDDPEVVSPAKDGSGSSTEKNSIASIPGCSDYPDDAVMIEETIEAVDDPGTPDPADDWMDYPESEWETWP